MNAKIITLLLAISILLVSSVIAADVCCEKLEGSEDYCVYTDEAKCDSRFKKAATTCEQTSFCKIGCCYTSSAGECYKNVGRAECASVEESSWTESANCEIDQCKKGCCVLGSQGFFVTEVKCKQETSNYGNVTMEWKPEILTEPECQAQAKSQEMGCCVSGEECTFTSRELCSTASLEVVAGNQTGSDNFYKDMLCSNDRLSCGCAKQTNTGCYDDKVYWFDSCGNRENVYSADKPRSYNNGYTMGADDVCDSPAVLSPYCGNCDYGEGSICRATSVVGAKTEPKYGNHICSKTACDETYSDGISPSAGGAKKNGESWCLYDSRVGKAQDLVGSRHYRRICLNGEELTEPCMDYREEMCVQGVLGQSPTKTYAAFQATGDYIEATCRDNRWEDCFECNEAEAGCGSECSGATAEIHCDDCSGDQKEKIKEQASKLAIKLCCSQKCCEKESLRDCHYMADENSKKGKEQKIIVRAVKGAILSVENIGYCVPTVPPGLQFWPEGTTEPPTSSTRSTPATTAAVTTGDEGNSGGSSAGPNSNAEGVCAQANQQCKVVWKISGTGRLGISGDKYECIQNCQCMEKEWVIAGNTLCKAQGDCGAYYNVLGKATLDGYSNTASGEEKGDKNLYFDGYELTRKDLGDWKEIYSKGDVIKGDFGMGFMDYISEFGVPLAFFTFSGIMAYAGGGEFLAGIIGGPAGLISAIGPSTIAGEWSKSYGSSSTYKLGDPITKGSTFDTSTLKSAFGKDNFPSTEGLPKGTTFSPGTSGTEFQLTSDGTWKCISSGGCGDAPGKMATTKGSGTMMGTLNTIMWLYTIYKMIDIFLTETKERTYAVGCAPWVAPEGGKDCTKCNDDEEKPCSLYRCKSLGQNCYLVNQGTSEEKCINIHPNDVNSPIIEPWEEVIPEDYTITPTTAEGNKGYKVNEKIGPYDTMVLGITTDEPAQCKFIDEVGKDFDEMALFFGESTYTYEHEMVFTMPPEFTTKEALKKLGSTYNLYIRCKDSSGNKNERDYFIRFSLKPEPDLTPPTIERTSIDNGAYVPNSFKQTDFSIYVDERAKCKYSTVDKEYDLMEKEFECSTSPFTTNSVYHGLYDCKTILELPNVTLKEYEWYIRCIDTSGNKNSESYKFTLKGSDLLEITSVGPTGTFFNRSEVVLEVTTAKGAEEGKATCAYSTSDDIFGNMILFFETNSTNHKQPLTPGDGDFTYYIKCLDVAGNLASNSTTFNLDVDTTAPELLYVYITGSNYLHIETDEPSTCQYGNSTFSYGVGKDMTGVSTEVHELPITDKVYHIICQDIYLNEAKFLVYP